MGSLLQLLVGIAAQQQEEHNPTRVVAAAAVRVLTSSALHLGWNKLHLATPLLLQVSQPQPSHALGYLSALQFNSRVVGNRLCMMILGSECLRSECPCKQCHWQRLAQLLSCERHCMQLLVLLFAGRSAPIRC
jgi:hypothetical protein